MTKPPEIEVHDAEKQKRKKAKKNKAAVNGDAGDSAVPTESGPNTKVTALERSSDVPEILKVKKKTKPEPKVQKAFITDNTAIASTPKKKGLSASNFHAEKIKKLLGQKDELPMQNKKAKEAGKVPGGGLTAGGINGVTGNNADESLDTVAKDVASTTMQAEAQRTTERELQDEFNSEESEEEIDQVGALLNGFDSDTEDLAEDEGFDKNNPVTALPNHKKTQKKLQRVAQKGNKDGPGVVYVGRIPHGFYENEMRQYFSQFGTITKLRLSRNRKTGHSKHFAFLEFESDEVAKIVAETMDAYLMFGHILRCRYVQPEALHPDTFKGANKRFRVAPHNRMEKRALEAPKSESQWTKKNTKEQAKREKKAEKLKAMGYEIELPNLKSPTDVLQQKEAQAEKDEKEFDVAGAEKKGVSASTAASRAETENMDVPAPTAVPKDEVAPSKNKAKKSKKSKKETAAVNADTPADLVQLQNGTEKEVKKRQTKKEKRENAKDEDKQLAAQLMVDETLPMTNAKPAKDGVEATTITATDSAKASKSSKRNKKKANGEETMVKTDKTSAADPAPAPTQPEAVAVQTETFPRTVPAGTVEEGKSQTRSRKKKNNTTTGDEVAEFTAPSTEPVAQGPKEQKKVKGEAKTKSILKKAKKA